MLKRIILIFICLSISISSYSATLPVTQACTNKICLIVPWPKECDTFCTFTAIENSSYSELIYFFKFPSDLARAITQVKNKWEPPDSKEPKRPRRVPSDSENYGRGEYGRVPPGSGEYGKVPPGTRKGTTLLETYEKLLSPEEMQKVYDTMRSLSPEDQREIAERLIVSR